MRPPMHVPPCLEGTEGGGSISASASIVVATDQVSCRVSQDFIILNLKNCVYYGLESAGAHVWSLLRAQQAWSVVELRDAILERYEVEAGRVEKDLVDLLEKMRLGGLIEVQSAPLALQGGGRNKPAIEARPKAPYSTMGLTVYGTIEELTQANGLHGSLDGGTLPNVRTHF